MKTPTEVWDRLVELVEPSTVADGEIQSVGVTLTKGGVKVKTTDPIPVRDFDDNWDSFDPEENDPEEYMDELDEIAEAPEDIEDMPENEEVFLYNQFGLNLKSIINERIRESILEIPTWSNSEVRRCTITESEISPIIRLTHDHRGEQWIKEDLAEALTEEEIIESSDKLAYGTVDSVYYDDSSQFLDEGWSVDGTLYRYTDEPYKYWSGKGDGDYPSNIDEWAEFVSDNEDEHDRIKNRDKHVVHFHPMKRELSENSPLIRWYKDVENHTRDLYNLNEEMIRNVHLSFVEVDETGVKTGLDLTL